MTRMLLRGATVVSMAADRPDFETADILVDGEKIAEVGRGLNARDVETIDFSGRILIPGLINAHLHSWQAALRSLGSDWTLEQYLAKVHAELSSHFTHADMQIAAFACALNQINCGTTTLGDWSHNARTPEHADGTIRGLSESGIRAVYFHGTPHKIREAPHPVKEVDRLLDGPIANNHLLTLGMAIPGPQYSSSAIALADFRAARDRGLVVSMHQSGGEPGAAWEAVRDAGLIGERTNIVHGNTLSDEWLKILVDSGASFTSTPENEQGQGHGFPLTGRLRALGAAASIGTDTDTLVSGEVLLAARIALARQRAFDHEQHRQSTGLFSPTPTVTSKQALAWVTIEGARSLGLSDRVGRLEPGMQADIVAIDTRGLNLWPAHDPVATALQASIANIEAVMVAGRWRKREHSLVGVELEPLRQALLESGNRLIAVLESSGLLARLKRKLVRRVVHRTLVKRSRA